MKKKKNSTLKNIFTTCIILTLLSVAAALGLTFLIKGSLPFSDGNAARKPQRYTPETASSSADTYERDESGMDTGGGEGTDGMAGDDDIPSLYNPDRHEMPKYDDTPGYDNGSGDDGIRPYGYYNSIGTTADDANRRATKTYGRDDTRELTGADPYVPDIISSIGSLSAEVPMEYDTFGLNREGNGAVDFSDPRNFLYNPTPDSKVMFPKPSESATGTTRIAFIGDSITFGAILENPAAQAFPALLQSTLGPGYQCLNFGRGGAGLSRKSIFPYWKQPEYTAAMESNADIYVIMLGSNDAVPILWNKEEFIMEYTNLVKACQARPGYPKVILMTPCKFYGTTGFSDHPDSELYDSIISGEIIPTISDISRSMNLPLVDMYNFTSGHPDWFPDTIHPNAQGHLRMAGLLASLFRQLG